jgi:hypothetical protein
MRITITHSENKFGFFGGGKTKFGVRTLIEFTPEETAILKARDLFSAVLIHPEGEVDPYTVGDFAKREQIFSWFSFIEAKNYETELKEALVNLKKLIEVGAAATPGQSETFEL